MQTTIASPVGPLALTVDDDGALTRLGFGAGDDLRRPPLRAGRHAAARVLRRRAHRLRPRPASRRRHRLRAARLDRAAEIPYGETASYGEIAARIGHPGKARAVGRANGRNPIAIVCPCHRVIGSDGSLTGYGGGLENKRTLLDLEAGALTLAMDTA